VPVLIRWVLVRDPLGQFETRALLSTDLSLSAKEIVELFTRRWQVEVTFEETRAHLGIETQRQWNRRRSSGPRRSCWDCSRWSRCWRITSSSSLPEHCGHAACAWYAKGHPSFSDALARVRAHLWQESFCLSGQTDDSQKTPGGV